MMSRIDAVDAYPGPHERRELAFLTRDGREFQVECVCTSEGDVTCEKATWLDGDGEELELTDDETEAAARIAHRGGGW